MTLADKIRWYAIENYVDPARQARRPEVTVRAGEIHKEMGLSGRLPAVCGALGTIKFLEYANLELLDRTGPNQGASSTFRYRIK